MEKEKLLLELYKKTLKAQDFFAEKGWESIKFHILLSSSLVSITVGALIAMHTSSVFNGLKYEAKGLLTSILAVLPITMFFVLRVGAKNFTRECKRMYEQSTIFFKLEERLGFWQDRDKNQMKGLPKDDKYFPNRYKEYFTNDKWSNSEDFVEDIMSRGDTLYGNMKTIFKIFKISSVILIIIISIVTVLHIIPIFSGAAII